MQDSLGNTHARRCISTVDVRHFQFPFSGQMTLKVATEGFGENGFPASYWTGDDGSGCSLR
jgi:hypothetical protein